MEPVGDAGDDRVNAGAAVSAAVSGRRRTREYMCLVNVQWYEEYERGGVAVPLTTYVITATALGDIASQPPSTIVTALKVVSPIMSHDILPPAGTDNE